MDIKTSNSCINCDNLMNNSLCRVNNTMVVFDQTCEKFDQKLELHKDSDCGNCVKHNQTTCAHPATASEGMLCTSYAIG
ncbi:hypothetical protein FUAX_49630 (plasmid) [Fulvitalea axinellae]|uniref:DUF1540 domain-containing protein n=1 Tax=Fulvitalea axinellae TaxID=1182444 RepID=A0AAU9CKE9_9BACT|nr:hypothetical protein FUAX_49630 [Fulvitalea axinellae]